MIPSQWSPLRDDGLRLPEPEEDNTVPGTGRALPTRPEPDWATNPQYSREWTFDGPDGEPTQVRLYTIGAVASALGKAPVTIRQWIRTGIVPDTRWRKPDTKGGYLSTNGARLWTREQIEALVDIAASEGLLGNHRTVSWTQSNFRQRVAHKWRLEGW